ncbi:ribonuclease P protein component [Allocatelliglobosispora scoriae]|uniref:Ribonuclease P protein component n=1 Tax=Allocatelliglobosispora scoriae TaxID=643052 RepID=A0A841BV29_9ACTN|nr:ribonuclease P protein component [Allocatelliglobosispora scoriae]
MRNTVKRRLRHLVATRLDSLPIGTTIVVRALPAAALAAYSQLELDLDAALAAAQRPRKSDRAAR